MPLNAHFIGSAADWDAFGPALTAEFSALPYDLSISPDITPSDADYIVMAGPQDVVNFAPYTRCKALLRLWAGVEDIAKNDTISFPICRMVGGGLDAGMVEWVTAHALRHHIGMDQYIHGQDGVWRNSVVPVLAADRPITILGLGVLGTACAQSLAALGFPVTGWSRSPKKIAGIKCMHGPVHDALKDAQIVVALLPRTKDTENTLNAAAFAQMAKGAVVLNPGRGDLIDDDALLNALSMGQVSHATLDVFRKEPLPKNHPFWAHPHITVTPHIASATRPKPAAKVISENIIRCETGKPLLHMVNRAAGY